MKHGSLFSGGCDGFSLAAKWAGWQTVFQVEQNEFRKNTLAKNFPEAKRYGDIRMFNAKPYRGTIDIISGGFPCQPFSVAGKQRGKADDRYLWPEMLRIVKEVRPSWVVGENVAAITKMALNEVLSNLEAIGYATGAYIIPACALNAPHIRYRVWIVAHRNNAGNGTSTSRIYENRKEKIKDRNKLFNEFGRRNSTSADLQKSEQKSSGTTRARRNGFTDGNIHAPDTNEQGLQRRHKQMESREKQSWPFRSGNDEWNRQWLEVAIKLCTMDDGLPEGLAKAERSAIYRAVKYFGRRETEKILGISLKKVNPWRKEELAAVGDAIVPQVAYEIFKAINEYTNEI